MLQCRDSVQARDTLLFSDTTYRGKLHQYAVPSHDSSFLFIWLTANTHHHDPKIIGLVVQEREGRSRVQTSYIDYVVTFKTIDTTCSGTVF